VKTSYQPAIRIAGKLLEDKVVSRIWERDPAVWRAAAGTPAEQSISTRLGWLDVPQTMQPHMDGLKALRDEVHSERVESVFLLGMGGSSLCAEVLRSVFGSAPGFPDVVVLDTTDERTLMRATESMHPERTWFLVSSKSGGTIDVASMERYFWNLMTQANAATAGRHFVAITDPGTGLDELATRRGYRHVFRNPADIGGRFSALSLFGLVPAAMMGAPVDKLMDAGGAMAEGCQQNNEANAGFELGAFIGGAALEGRDKLTVQLAPALRSLGLWIEQLIAESTGKHGKGVLPVVDEAPGDPDEYGSDRVFVSVATEKEHHDEAWLEALEAAGHPVLRLSTRLDGLGAEFFRWEFATAVAGAVLQINPFDEPNVAEAKEKTRALLTKYESRGAFDDSPLSGTALADAVRAALGSLKTADYVAFLSYLPADDEVERSVAAIRARIRREKKVASTFGVGPRYLHSTGQYHKGGPNTVVAFVITSDDETGTAIPDAGYTFSTLKRAQALGDVEALKAHGRRVARIHFPSADETPEALSRLFDDALTGI
jgi:glucose-6-phosphate isomerase